MQAQATVERGPLCVARGYGIKIYTRYGHLIVEDGAGRDRRTRRYHRALSKLKRLVLIGHTGFVTLEAMAWLRHANAALVQLDSHGQLIATTAPAGTDHSELRRAQALARGSSTGLETARTVLQHKLAGQAAIAADLTPQAPAIRQIQAALVALQSGRLMDELLVAESSAAEAYWTSWEAVRPNVRRRDRRRLPEHWMSFTARHSPLTSSPRSATDPVNALLNYLYALLEAETIIACHTLGLDPGLGLFHADRNGRASFALDLMEACRPTVDAYVLALLTERTLSARDFAETPRGICRLAPHLAEELAQSTLAWADHISPVAEDIAQLLLTPAGREVPTRLTRRKQTAAVRRSRLPALPRRCADCGGSLAKSSGRYCPSCRDDRWTEDAQSGRDAAAQVLARLRADERDPAHGGRAAVARGQKNAAHQRAVLAWNERDDDGVDRRVFVEEIQPRLGRATIGELVDATGLSAHYCSLIRLGKRVPHPRHWAALDACGS